MSTEPSRTLVVHADDREPARAGEASLAAAWVRRLAPHLTFALLALAFVAPALLPDRILQPTNLARTPFWRGEWPELLEMRSNNLMADSLIFTLPGRVYNHEMLSSGRVPLWNPYIFSGYPHLALIQNNALYPLSAPFDVIDPLSGLAWSALVHFALAGSLMYLFLRRLGLSVGAAIVGGAAFELNGMFLVRISAPSYVYSGIWLPLLLLGALRIVEERRLWSGWPIVAGTFLSVLGGHPQITALALSLAGLTLVVEAGAHVRREGAVTLSRALLAFTAAVLLGVGLAGFQVVPFLELMAHSARTSIPLEFYRSSALAPAGLLQALVPDVFGNPVERTYWFTKKLYLLDGLRHSDRLWGPNYCGENLYTGALPLFLAGVAVLRSPRRRETLFFALVAVASLGILFGSPLLDVAYFVLPGFRHSRPDRIVFLYMAAIAVLAALGFDATRRRATGGAGSLGDREPSSAEAARWHPGRACSIAFLLLVLVSWRMVPRLLDRESRLDLAAWLSFATIHWSEDAPLLLSQLALLLFVVSAAAILAWTKAGRRLGDGARLAIWVALLAVPSLAFGWHFNPAQVMPPLGTTDAERFLLEHADGGRIARVLKRSWRFLPANVSQMVGLHDVNGASAAGVDSYMLLMSLADPASVAKSKYFRGFRDPAVARGNLLDVLGARIVLSDGDLSDVYEPIGGKDKITFYENPNALPRFRVVTRYEVAGSEAEARVRVLSPEFDVQSSVVLLEDPELVLRPARASDPAPRVEVEREEAHDIDLRVDAPRGGVLVISDTFYPGWRARIDGASRRVLQANAAFRAIALPPGAHDVELEFRPLSFRLGIAVSLASLIVLAGLVAAGRRGRRSS